MYAQDYDERMPPPRYSISGDPEEYTAQLWSQKTKFVSGVGTVGDMKQGLIFPYTKSDQILVCPSMTVQQGQTNYGINVPLGIGTGIPLASVDLVAETVLMGDAANAPSTSLMNYAYFDKPSSTTPTVHARHQERANILWMDGHVKSSKVSLDYRASQTNAAVRKSFKVGNLLHPQCPIDSACQDYYFDLVKPALP